MNGALRIAIKTPSPKVQYTTACKAQTRSLSVWVFFWHNQPPIFGWLLTLQHKYT